jgi:thioredoxin 1
MTIIQTTDSAFEADVLKSEVPVVVDFWAEWCGPCKTIAPFLEDLASEKNGRVRVAKVNIDDNPLTPTKYGVRGIPTLMLFKNGEIAATKVGAMPKTKLYEWVEESI